MELLESTRTTTTQRRVPRLTKFDLVRVPGDQVLGPFFAAKPQTDENGREVQIGKKLYQIGGPDRLRRHLKHPAFDTRHARVLFTALSLRNPFDTTARISFSMNQFCKLYANSNCGRYSRDMIQLFADLADTDVRVTDLETGEVEQYRFIANLLHYNRAPRRRDALFATSPQQELWIDGCELSPEFLSILGRVSEFRYLKVRVLNSIRSPLAQAIYLYIPSRAYHHTEEQPFEITVTNLLEQVSFPVPKYKSLRKQLFTQHKRSVLTQLDGLETIAGHFRVSLCETHNGDDWKLQAWEEKDVSKKKFGETDLKLVAAYRESGRPMEWLEEAFGNLPALSDYDIDLLKLAEVEIEKNMPFFKKAKALLKEQRFSILLAEAKGDALEGRPARKNPTARLISRIMRTVRTPPGRPLLNVRI